MHRLQRLGVGLVIVAILSVGCGTPDPSPTLPTTLGSPVPLVTPAASTPPSSVPSAQPSATTAPSAPLPSASTPTSGDPLLGSVVKTVSDRLRVRSAPRVAEDSEKYEPLLPLGTELQVIGGPVTDSGYTWYEVTPMSFVLATGADHGWVAMGDKDGTPWIGLAEPPISGLEVAESALERLPAKASDARKAGTSVNTFGLDLYHKLLEDPDLAKSNVVFSPTSIALALGLARAGAKGQTAAQIDDVLHTTGWEALGPGLNALDQALSSRDGTYQDDEGKTHPLSLRIANTSFAQHGWSIVPAYLDRIAQTFGAGLQLIDYMADPEAARRIINAWVSRQTEHRIPELLEPPNVTTDTRLYLVNAMYLKANWLRPFQDDGTTNQAFRRLDGSSVKVPTMQVRGEQEIPYLSGVGWKATELRYRGRDGTYPLAMTLILPDDLATFEDRLTAKGLASITTSLTKERQRLTDDVREGAGTEANDCGSYPYSLRLSMPRFSIDTRTELGLILKTLGMPLAFDTVGADFTGIHVPDAEEGRISISDVIHQANIDVDEKGTTAAAATAIGMDTGGCTGPSPAKEVTFRLDKPFLFVLRDLETGAVLFMGRVVDPAAA